MSGGILFTLQSPCCAVYCRLYSMRTALFGCRWKEFRRITVLLKRSVITCIWSLHVKTLCCKFSKEPSLTIFRKIYQNPETMWGCVVLACSVLSCACAAWLTLCDVVHVTPTLAACVFPQAPLYQSLLRGKKSPSRGPELRFKGCMLKWLWFT